MTAHRFPALGFDPAPGDPEALEVLGTDCVRLAGELADDADRVRILQRGVLWSGRAAEAFVARLEDLPRDLDRAAEAHREAGRALGTFDFALRSHQAVARDLEASAQEQQRLLVAAASQVAAADPGARTPAQCADDALQDVLRAAHRLRGQVLDDAALAERALRNATRHAPSPPGWFHRATSAVSSAVKRANRAVGDFVRDHAVVIATLAGVASKVSSALAVVAMLAGPIPILGQAVAAVASAGALVAAGVALAGHGALALYAGGSWTPVLLDAAGLLTGGAAKGVEAVGARVAVSRGLEMSPEAFDGLRGAASVLRHPGAAWTASAGATMTMPTLVTRTVAYQFDLAGAALGTFDLALTGALPAEAREAQERATERTEDLEGERRDLRVEGVGRRAGVERVGGGP